MPAADAGGGAGGGANGGVKIGCNRLGPRAVHWIRAGLVWLSTNLATALTGLALGLTLGFSSAGGDAAYLFTGEGSLATLRTVVRRPPLTLRAGRVFTSSYLMLGRGQALVSACEANVMLTLRCAGAKGR